MGDREYIQNGLLKGRIRDNSKPISRLAAPFDVALKTATKDELMKAISFLIKSRAKQTYRDYRIRQIDLRIRQLLKTPTRTERAVSAPTITTTYAHCNGESANPYIQGYYWIENIATGEFFIFYYWLRDDRWSVNKYTTQTPHINMGLGAVRIYGPIPTPVSNA